MNNSASKSETRFSDVFMAELRKTLRSTDRAHDERMKQLQTRLTISTLRLLGVLVPDAGLAAVSALFAAFGALIGFAGSVVVMSVISFVWDRHFY